MCEYVFLFIVKVIRKMSREVFMKHRAISGFGNTNVTIQKLYLISCSIVYILRAL